jgi:hypothetical protein
MLETDHSSITADNHRSIFANGEKFGSTSTGNQVEALPTHSLNGGINGKEYMSSPTRETKPASRGRKRASRIYLNRFRIPIYVQLCVVICILCGVCVMVVAVSTVSSPLIRLISSM